MEHINNLSVSLTPYVIGYLLIMITYGYLSSRYYHANFRFTSKGKEDLQDEFNDFVKHDERDSFSWPWYLVNYGQDIEACVIKLEMDHANGTIDNHDFRRNLRILTLIGQGQAKIDISKRKLIN